MALGNDVLKIDRLYKVPVLNNPNEMKKLANIRARGTARVRYKKDWQCERCATTFPKTEKKYIKRFGRASGDNLLTESKVLCRSCMNKFSLCPICGGWHVRRTYAYQVRVKVKGHPGVLTVGCCDMCYQTKFFTCGCCGKSGIVGTGHESGGAVYCEACFSKFVPCDGCGAPVSPNSDRIGPHLVCDKCRPKFTPRVQGYSHRPVPIFFSEKQADGEPICRRGNLYMGVELEIDDGIKGLALSRALAKNKSLYLKHDGSLSEIGIEIVTHPATLDAHRSIIGWSEIVDACKHYKYKSFDASHSCGMHVHTNRDFLDARYTDESLISQASSEDKSMSLVKLTSFVYGNADHFSALAQRTSEHYARMSSVKAPKDLRTLSGEISLKRNGNLSRYQGLNFCNRSTVEWRMFRGTLNLETLLATLELVDAVNRFVLATSVAALFSKDKGWGRFCSFVEDQPKQYKGLKAYMVTRGVWVP